MNKTLSFDIQCGNYFCLDEETGGYCEFCLMNPSDLHCMFFDQELEEEEDELGEWGVQPVRCKTCLANTGDD